MSVGAVDGLPSRPSRLDMEESLRSLWLLGFPTEPFVLESKSCKIRRFWRRINNEEVGVVGNVTKMCNLNW